MSTENRDVNVNVNVDGNSNGVEKSLDDIAGGAEKAADSLNKTGDATGNLKEGLDSVDSASGGLLSTFKKLAKNPFILVASALIGIFTTIAKVVQRSGKATDTFNKIGAKFSSIINGALAFLEPFVELLGEKLLNAIENPGEAFRELGETIQNSVINRFKALGIAGRAILKILQGDFKEGLSELGDAALQLGTGLDAAQREEAFGKLNELIEDGTQRAKEAASATIDLASAQRRLIAVNERAQLAQIEGQTIAEKERQIRDDTRRSIEERIEANTRLGEALTKQLEIEKGVLNEQVRFAQLRIQAEGDSIENLQELSDLRVKLAEINERITGQRSEQLANEAALEAERAAMLEEAALKEAEAEQTRLDAIQAIRDEFRLKQEDIDAENEVARIELEQQRQLAELERLNASEEQKLEVKRFFAGEIARAEAEAAEQAKEAEIAELEEREAQRQANFDNAKGLVGLFEKLGGESATLAIAGIVAEQASAVSRIISNSAANIAKVAGTPAAPIAIPTIKVSAGIGIASSIAGAAKSIAAIKGGGKTPVGGGGGAGGGGAIPSGPAEIPIDDLAANNAARLGIDPQISGDATATAANNVNGGSSGNVVFSEGRFNEFQDQVKTREGLSTV